MRRTTLGNTGIQVSRLCLGTGTTGFACQSQQSRQPPSSYGRLLKRAHALGITFWDTSDDYGTHPHIRAGLDGLERREVIVTTKTHAAAADDTRRSVLISLAEMGLSYVDIVLMHEVDSPAELHQRRPALEELHRLKEAGLIRAVGLSTHNIDTLELAVGYAGVEVLFTNVNFAGVHMDADKRDYLKALEAAFEQGQGIYVHKTLGEGRLANRLEEALRFNFGLPFVHSICVGINTVGELEEVVQWVEAIDRAEDGYRVCSYNWRDG